MLALAAHILRAPAASPPDDGPASRTTAAGRLPDWDAFDRERETWAREPGVVR